MPSPLASRIVKYSPSFGRPRTSGERSDIHTAASSDSPRSSLKKTLNASSTSIRPKSHVCGTPPRSPPGPVTPGSRSVATRATTVATNASVPGHSPAARSRIRSTAITARTPIVRISSGANQRRLSTVPIAALATRDARARRRRLHLLGDLDQAWALQVQDRLRVDAEEEDDRGQGYQREQLAAVDLPAGGLVLGIRRSEVHALERPQHVARRQHDGAGRHDGERGV